jgi:hypothetical protein
MLGTQKSRMNFFLRINKKDCHHMAGKIKSVECIYMYKVFLGVWFFDYFCYNLRFWDFENVQNEVTL